MAAADGFSTHRGGLDGPYTKGEAVTPHDVDELANVSRAIWVGGAGAVTALMADDSVLTFAAVPAGELLKIRAKRINDTGTDATSIVALS